MTRLSEKDRMKLLFIDSIRIQAMFIANLVALTPIIAPLIHLARLVHAFERAKEAEAIVKAVGR